MEDGFLQTGSEPMSPDAQFAPLEEHRLYADPRSTAAYRQYTLGDVRMLALSDGFIVMNPDFLGTPEHPTAAHDVLHDELGEMAMPLGCFLIPGEANVLIDLGYGPHDQRGEGRMVGGNLIAQLRRAGFSPEDIDIVALSHLHPDHIGWLGDQGARPTFANAQLCFGVEDWRYFVDGDSANLPLAPHLEETLRRLEADGRVTLLDSDAAVTKNVTRFAAPGHTPGHSIFAVHSRQSRALLFGDAMYCAQQLTETDWAAMTDVDPKLARRTRERFVRELEDEGGSAIGCHFPGLTASRVMMGSA
jgi:glyoxylase-like metal-dependent hydrolase (beta-lactamase superfamily II)